MKNMKYIPKRTPKTLFKVLVHYEDGDVVKLRTFTCAVKADSYFKKLCRTRSALPAAVVGSSRSGLKKYFRIDKAFSGEESGRSLLDLNWIE